MRPYLTPDITYQTFQAFGWNVQLAQVQPPTYWYVRIPKLRGNELMSTNKASYITIYTKGRIEIINFMTGESLPDKIPGSNTLDKEFLVAGNYKLTAMDLSEWICISYHFNNNTLPTIEIVKDQQGTITFNTTKLGLVCRDTGTAKLDQTTLTHLETFTLEPGQTLELAQDDLIAFFDRHKL
jgi:hypothetical protein